MKIGELLKQARLEKGWTLDEISKDLYIQRRYLEALEAGKYEIIPGEAYQRAYFRKYAEHLGIADYIDSLTRPHGTMEKQKNDKEHDILGGQWDTARITRVSLKIGIPVLIVLLLIGARANFAKRAEPEPEESVQSTRPIEVVPYEENRSWHLPSEPGYENPVQAIDDNTHELRLTASGECWVELKTRDSQLIPGRNLVLGESLTFHDPIGFYLFAGKPEKLDVELDGELIPWPVGVRTMTLPEGAAVNSEVVETPEVPSEPAETGTE